MDKQRFFIFPNQLFYDLPYKMKENDTVYIIEHPNFFKKYVYHYLHLLHQVSSMYHYKLYLKEQCGVNVHYIKLEKYEEFKKYLTNDYNFEIKMYDTIDKQINDDFSQIKNKKGVNRCIIFDSPSFMETHKDIKDFIQKKGNKHILNNDWYVFIRKRLNILMRDDKPEGGQFSFDKYNRQHFDENIQEKETKFRQDMLSHENDKNVQEAHEYLIQLEKKGIIKIFGKKDIKCLVIPVTHKQSKSWLEYFINNKLQHFGKYQDAIDLNISYGFHSVLSQILNTGLLLPRQVIHDVLEYYKKHKNIELLHQIEGFIRQIIGWRSYTRIIYQYFNKEVKNSNYLENTHRLPSIWFNSNEKIYSGIYFVDSMINKLKTTGYLHHIERLMIMGNYFLFCQIKPWDVIKWFMMFIDSYEWVMFSNVLILSQFANNQFSYKCYICTTNYLDKQSNGQIKHDRNDIWNHLYYKFINDKQRLIQNSSFYQIQKWNQKKDNEKKEILQKALEYLEKYMY